MHALRAVPDNSDRAHRWQRLFRGQESELRQLRHWLIELLPDSPGRDDLISVAVELGTNAVQHTASGDGGWFTVEVARRGPVLRVSVTDEGAERGPSLAGDPPAAPTGDASDDPYEDILNSARCDRGRGLLIVRALAVTYGVCGNASGRTVWAEVAQADIQAEAHTQALAAAPVRFPTSLPARTPASARIQTRTTPRPRPAGTNGTNGTHGSPNGQGRSSRPSASSARASSRTL